MLKEIELGNGYGYFCNIHDIENQNPIIEPIYINNYCKYLEEIDRYEDPSTDTNYALCSCSCSLFACMITIFLFIL
jgi:hypothetical protein